MSRRLLRPRDGLPAVGKSRNSRRVFSMVARPGSIEEFRIEAISPSASIPDVSHRRSRLTTASSVTAAVFTALYGTPSGAAPDTAPTEDFGLQEVVVTASRRAVSAQDLPVSITAVTGAELDQAGIVDMAGLAHAMAGVNYTDKGPFGGVNGANLIIRGLNSETTAGLPAAASPVVPPVATYVDDTPLVRQSSAAGSRPCRDFAWAARHAVRLRLARRHDSFRTECPGSDRLRCQGRSGGERYGAYPRSQRRCQRHAQSAGNRYLRGTHECRLDV